MLLHVPMVRADRFFEFPNLYMYIRKNVLQNLFWIAILIYILFNVERILATPTLPASHVIPTLVINELMATNSTGLQDEDAVYADWIELHNRSNRAIDLSQWSLTNDPEVPDKWLLPARTLASGDYLLLFASGKDRGSLGQAQDVLHTDFRLNGEGDFLALYNTTSRRFLDSTTLQLPVQRNDISFGRHPNGEMGFYFKHPTPGAVNDVASAWRGMVSPVAFDTERGLYDRPIQVSLTAWLDRGRIELGAAAAVNIHYTTDGSEPTAAHGTLYTEPILIEKTTPLRALAFAPDALSAPVVTHTYLFIEDVLTQSANPSGFPESMGQHQIAVAGYEIGTPRLVDYEMDPEIVNDPTYGAQIRAGLETLPTVSLVTDMAHFSAVYSTPSNRGPEAERPVSVEIFHPDGRQESGQINAGFRIQGGAGRWEYMPKHSFRLFFRSAYGPGQFRYPLFPDSPVTEFDTLVLRAGMDRNYAGNPDVTDGITDHRLATYTRDEWGRASQIAMSGIGSHGLFVHLYINGLYWGLYNLVERPDESFATAYLGGTKEEWYTANHGGSVYGPIDRFSVLLQLAEAGGLADPDSYATMLEFIDPVQFSDYVILNWYVGNRDWPENNWYVNVRYPAGRNLFLAWDVENSWNHGATVHLGPDAIAGAPFPNVTKLVFNALIENPDFRLTFADRLYKHLYNTGALSTEQALARWHQINQPIEKAIIAESARWGDARYAAPITQDDWRKARDSVSTQMVGNGEKLRLMVEEAGYYPAVEPPTFSQHGGLFEPPLVLTMAQSTALSSGVTPIENPVAIYFTTDGTDPRLAGSGAIAPSANRYESAFVLEGATLVKARVRQGDQWSPLQEAQFWQAGQKGDLRITELMYNPLVADQGSDRQYDSDQYEYIELKNVGDLTLDLSGAYFEGIDFRFPRYRQLAPGEHLVLIKNFSAFRSRYAEAEIGGIYEGLLSNQGETVAVRDANGHLLTSVTYDDENGWSLSADGRGDSLVLTDLTGRPDDPQSWQASANLHGSPYADEP